MKFTRGFVCSEALGEGTFPKAQGLARGSRVDLQGGIIGDAMESVEEIQEQAPSQGTERGALQKAASSACHIERIQQHEVTN